MVAAKSVVAESVVATPVLTPGPLNPRTSLSVLSDRLRPELYIADAAAARRYCFGGSDTESKHVVEQNSPNLALSEGAKLREFGV